MGGGAVMHNPNRTQGPGPDSRRRVPQRLPHLLFSRGFTGVGWRLDLYRDHLSCPHPQPTWCLHVAPSPGLPSAPLLNAGPPSLPLSPGPLPSTHSLTLPPTRSGSQAGSAQSSLQRCGWETCGQRQIRHPPQMGGREVRAGQPSHGRLVPVTPGGLL